MCPKTIFGTQGKNTNFRIKSVQIHQVPNILSDVIIHDNISSLDNHYEECNELNDQDAKWDLRSGCYECEDVNGD